MPSGQRLALPLSLFAGVLAAVLLALPRRTYGDDVFFVWCIVRDRAFVPHFLYMPLARAWTHAGALLGVDPFLALRWLSAAGAAAGTALLAAAARRRGADAWLAAALALLVLTASSTWFFAGAAEIHAVHLAAFGLLAWTLAGFSPTSTPWRALAVALAFGLAVGAHKSTGLFLPGVLAGYALLTPLRPRRARLGDLLAFGAGGLASLGVQLLVQSLATGRATTAQDTAGYWLNGLGEQLPNLAPGILGPFLAEAVVAPACALVLLGAAAAGTLLRARPRLALALFVTLLPHLVFFPLFGWEERGAYYIVTLPVLTWAVARAAAGSGAPRAIAQRAFTALCVAVAAVLALRTPEELRSSLGTAGLLALPAAAFAGGFLLPHHAWLSPRRAALVALALAACQLVGAQRELSRYDSGDPLLAWGRDAVAATGPGCTVVTGGFERFFLLRLLDRPWPAPYTDTWAYARSLGSAGPQAFDAGDLTADNVERRLSEGGRVLVLDTAYEVLARDPLRSAYLRALEQRFHLTPVEDGAFKGFEVTR